MPALMFVEGGLSTNFWMPADAWDHHVSPVAPIFSPMAFEPSSSTSKSAGPRGVRGNSVPQVPTSSVPGPRLPTGPKRMSPAPVPIGAGGAEDMLPVGIPGGRVPSGDCLLEKINPFDEQARADRPRRPASAARPRNILVRSTGCPFRLISKGIILHFARG